jgi:hypothetical protein
MMTLHVSNISRVVTFDNFNPQIVLIPKVFSPCVSLAKAHIVTYMRCDASGMRWDIYANI